jgi:hypothetical protein
MHPCINTVMVEARIEDLRRTARSSVYRAEGRERRATGPRRQPRHALSLLHRRAARAAL